MAKQEQIFDLLMDPPKVLKVRMILAALKALLRSLTWPGPIPWAQAEAAIRRATGEGE